MDRGEFSEDVELLAPAGRWEALQAVLQSGTDAVYIAGKEYNMRMHRRDFNFSRDEMARATEKVHAAGSRIYIAVNSLLSDRELEVIGEYLSFLESIGVDGMIVQDLGLIHLVGRLGLNLHLHASTMMNIHSGEGAKACAELGIERIICSRDVTLAQVKEMKRESGLAMEYFIHGDMCIAQSGQCYMSGILFGKSSNRGGCMKPCRWTYQMATPGRGNSMETRKEGSHLLATKDMCLVGFIPELIEAGITSLKIEGRMRAPDFLTRVVAVYRKALDAYRADPLGYVNNIHGFEDLYRNRVRDFSTCCALKKPDGSLVGSSGKREPLFLSTSARVDEIDLLHPWGALCTDEDPAPDSVRREKPLLAVHVGSPGSAREALEQGADWVYIGGEVSPFRGQRWNLASIGDTVSRAHDRGKRVGIATPRVTLERQLNEIRWALERLSPLEPDAILVHNLGTLRLVREYGDIPLHADYSLNVLNGRSLEELRRLGVRQVTLSLEASFDTLQRLAASAPVPLECIVHGPIPAMYLEHCLISMTLMNTSSHDPCRGPCRYLQYGLSDPLMQVHPIEVDQYCRTHILLSRDLACLNYIAHFARTGVRTLRIEAQYYREDLVGILTGLYSGAIKHPEKKIAPSRVKRLVALSPRGFSLGAYPKGIFGRPSSSGRLDRVDSAQALKECRLVQSSTH